MFAPNRSKRRKVWPRPVRFAAFGAAVAVSATAVVHFAVSQGGPTAPAVLMPMPVSSGSASSAAPYRFERLTAPARTVMRDSGGDIIATFTDGARTVVLTGPTRTFSDPRFTSATVTSRAWVRLAPNAWRAGDENAQWFSQWLPGALRNRDSDVLATAAQYLDGARDVVDETGVRIGGDASFGPVRPGDPAPLERSDFYDYLGITWHFPGGVREQPALYRLGSVDCSGFVRLIYGYRMGFPLGATNSPGPLLPRRAFAMADFGPGPVVVPNLKQKSVDYHLLQPGDLVFFEIDGSNGDQIDHTGVYLGVDSNGHHRFISSRQRANGPTAGDLGGTSLLDDGGHYSNGFRTARRI